MIFESLWALAFFLTVPVVIILYLLRPRGKDYRISSTLLWDKLFRDQQSRTFLEKFVRNILMYLQILILALLVLALMSPYIHRQGKSGGNVILVFDTSGSMQHDAGDGSTRLEQALEQAEGLIASSEETAFSIVTCDRTGTGLLAAGVRDKRSLRTALGQIECCDGSGNLADAESVVETLRGAGAKQEEAQGAEVIVFTDGIGVDGAEGFSAYFDAQILVMGEAVSNVSNDFLSYAEASAGAGTVGEMDANVFANAGSDGGMDADETVNVDTDREMSAGTAADTEASTEGAGANKDETDHTGMITCASSLTNHSDAEAVMEVSLYAGERLIDMKRVSLAPDETSLCFFEAFAWQGEALRSEVSSVKFAGRDDADSLAADNTAYAVKEQGGSVEAVLIGDGNMYIERAYEAAFGTSLTRLKGESALRGGISGGRDGVTVADEPGAVRIYDAGAESSLRDEGCSLVFRDESCRSGSVEKVMLTAADCELTEGLSPFTVGANEAVVYEVPSWGTGFLWAGGQCAGYFGEHDGVRTVVVGFDIRESDFPLKAEFPVFMANVLHFLGDTSLLAEHIYEAGEAVVFHPQADLDVNMLIAETKKAGLYEVSAGDASERYVVRFATGSQSDGRITAEGTVPDTSYGGGLVKRRLRNVLLALALILMAVEWVVYVRQVRYRGRFYFGVRAAGMLLLILALLGVSVNRRGSGGTTVFLVDLSESNRANLSAMEACLREALDGKPKGDRYGIVTFGKDALVEQFLTEEDHFSQVMSLPDRTATNFEGAVSRALAMIPAGGAGRIVILTDGRETAGDLARTASALAAGQVELLAHVYEPEEGQDAYVENVRLPAYLYEGDLYSMTVSVESNYETEARIQILAAQGASEEYDVHLNRGSNQFRFQRSVTGGNVESLEVRVAAEGDSCEENNSYHAYAAVDSVPRVLLVSGVGEDSSQYEDLLRSAGYDMDSVSAPDAPDSLQELLEYRSVLLQNVYLADLPERFLENIETYVRDYGCGLVCAGGDDSFALGGYRDSVLETVLPVDMELRGVDEVPTTAMIMVIDHSGSMSMDAGGATNLDLAVAAAKAAVDQMRDSDYVGVISFDDRYDWVVEPTPAADREEIRAQIETIVEGGGTTIKPALWAALAGAEECDADIRHVILLTDGQGESRNYRDIIEEYTGAGVTLSTVAVGSDADMRLLEQLADRCGGRYYYSDMAADIPKIFAQEVFLSGDTYLQYGLFHLAVDGCNEITEGLFEGGWPEIYGYVSATPKGASSVLIASEKDDPLLTVMQYGLGHTVAWNTDVTNRWTARYAGESDYAQLWKRIVDYSVGVAAIGEDSVDVTTNGGSTSVVYHAIDYNSQTKVEAVYTDPDGNTQTASLQAVAPGRYEAELNTDITGLYNLSVRRLDGGDIANAVNTAVAVQYSDEYKFDVDAAAFMGFVERCGAMFDPGEDFWRQKKSSARERYELTKWLILLLIFWFVMDIALRRFYFLPQDTRLYRRVAGYRLMRKRRADRFAGEPSVQRTKAEEKAGKAGQDEIAGDRIEEIEKSREIGKDREIEKDKADGNTMDMAESNRITGGGADSDHSGRKKKRKEPKRSGRKEEAQALDTSVLLQKKDQRKQL